MTTSLAIPDAQTAIVPRYGWTRDQVDLIKATIAKGTTDDELALFCQTAKRMGLDPFAKQIYCQKRKDRRTDTEQLVILTGIDGYRLIGHRTGEVDGIEGPFWCGPDGQWREIWLDKGNPAGAMVKVYRKGTELPFVGVATWRSFAQTFRDGNPMGQWGVMPDVMLAKCAEAQAWRKAFPAELSGVHVPEEMDQADREPEVFERAPTVPTLPPAPAKTPAPRKVAPAKEVAPMPKEGDVIAPPTVRAPDMPGVAPAARTAYEESAARVEATARAAVPRRNEVPEIIEAEAFEIEPQAASKMPFDPFEAKLAEFRAELAMAKDGANMTAIREKWSPWCAEGAPGATLKATIGGEWTAKANEIRAAAAAAAKGGQ